MRVTVLIDNNTLIDRYYLGEPAVAFLIETEDSRVLFDSGYSDAFMRNARAMGVDLRSIGVIVLSHGHIDHTGGLESLVKMYTEERLEASMPGSAHVHPDPAAPVGAGPVGAGPAGAGPVGAAPVDPPARPTLIAHPAALLPKRLEDGAAIGISLSDSVLGGLFDVRPTRAPVWIDRRLVFLGEIERSTDFERTAAVGYRLQKTGSGPDYVADELPDDTALAYVADDGIVVITGCSHSGICNIVEQARRVTGIRRVIDVVGGFHLQDPPAAQLNGTVSYIASLELRALHACHCTDLRSKIALASVAPVREVGSGLRLQY